MVSEPETVFSSLATPVSQQVQQILVQTIARRLTPQPVKLRADIELTCYTPAGIDAIKKALRAGETMSNEAVPIKAKLVAPPLYVLSTNSTDKVHTHNDEHHSILSADHGISVCCRRALEPGYRGHSNND